MISDIQINHPNLGWKEFKVSSKWHNDRERGLGKRFTQHVRQKVHFSRRNPEAFEIRYKNTRTALLDTFPYLIHFTINEDLKVVIKSAVLSIHFGPRIWKESSKACLIHYTINLNCKN